MPFINLIQEQRLALRRDEMRARTFLYAFVAVGGLSLVATGSLFAETALANRHAEDLQQQIDKIKPIKTEIDKVNGEFAQLNPRVETLQQAQQITAHWTNILAHLNSQTPQKVWLTGIKCNAGDPMKPVTMTISGIGDKQEPIGDFILRLQNCDDLENTQLRFTQEKTAATFKGTEFQVDSDIKDSTDKKPEVKKEGEATK
jgi:Tfp pilus assembly protein PilN